MFPKLKFPDSSVIMKGGMISVMGNNMNRKNAI